MSREPDPSGWQLKYGPPNGGDHDRHIQSIISHTSNLFPDTMEQLPQIFTPLTDSWTTELSGHRISEAAQEEHGYVGLDDFDRQVLGRAGVIDSLSSFQNSSQPSSIGLRISLPPSTTTNKPSRVLGDASHHFRPFISRDSEHRSPFQSNLCEINNTQRLEQRFSDLEDQPYGDSPLTSSRQAMTGSPLIQSRPSRLNRPVFQRTIVNRSGESQRGAQLFGTSSHDAKITPSLSSITSSSPSNVGQSSPSTRIAIEREKQIASRDHQVPKWNERLQLDLEHAPNLSPIVNNTRLIDPRQSLPDQYRAVFPFPIFNVVQSRCFPLVFNSNANVVISAPTGAGKTVILELAICKLLSSQGGDNFKIIYQAPTKSLCSEKAKDWQKKFSHLNLKCVELTGDTSQGEAQRVGSATIIVTTPEKWDSITRKWKDHRRLLDLVRLVLIDEVHILKDSRGATLEAVVSRMKTIGAGIRFVAISATVPNIDDVAKWLGRDPQNQHEPARFEVFGEELRPVKLQRYVYGYEGAPNDFCFEKMLDGKLNLLLAKHSQRKPIMVFCITRKSCERTAQMLAEWWTACRTDSRAWPAPTNRIPVISQELQEIVRYGVAFHHAGLDAQDRASVEANFLNGQLHVICCTSTLAVGVNLPCHTVVLKGTSHFTDDGPKEYSDLEVMQMLGRAGRPQFDQSAAAIIMTRMSKVERYQKLVSGQELLESTLHRNLLEHLNSEIGLGTIQDMESAKKWIGGTFLSVRVRQSPALYHLDNVQNAAGADERMEEWCERDVNLLQEHGLVTKSIPFTCTDYGQAMSKYMVQFETMQLILKIPRAASIEDMLAQICQASEFRDFRFKPAERVLFRELNKSPLILHPIREAIRLGGVEITSSGETKMFRQDFARETRMVFDRLNRLVRCLIDCKASDGDGTGTHTALELARPAQLAQIKGFGPVAVRKWVSHGVRTVLGVADKSTLDIERIASRNPPYGRTLQKQLEDFPRLTLTVDVIHPGAGSPVTGGAVSIAITAHLAHTNAKPVPLWNNKAPSLTFVAINSNGDLAFLWRGNMRQMSKSKGIDLRFTAALTASDETIACYFSCEDIVGTQVWKTVTPSVPESAFSKSRSIGAHRSASDQNLVDDEDVYEGVSDEALLGVLKSPTIQAIADDYSDPADDGDDEFPLVEDILSQSGSGPEPDPEPARMDNGRYMCNHKCSNGQPTKTGKPCNHTCCHEGVDKYRPPKKLTAPRCTDDAHGKEDKCKGRRGEPEARAGLKKPIRKNKSTNANASTTEAQIGKPPSHRENGIDIMLQRGGKRKQEEVHSRPKDFETREHKRQKPSCGQQIPTSPTDMEYIDLCGISDDGDLSPVFLQPGPSTNQRQRGKLLVLQEKAGGLTGCPPPLTKHISKTEAVPPKINKEEDGNAEKTCIVPNSTTKDSHKATMDDGFTDYSDDVSELPELSELFGGESNTGPLNSKRAISPQKGSTRDETLYPGVVATLKESMDYGWESNLSFTTVEELQKASERFGLPPIEGEERTNVAESEASARFSLDSAFFGLSSPSAILSLGEVTTRNSTTLMHKYDEGNGRDSTSDLDENEHQSTGGTAEVHGTAEPA
ncbi:hypothetical protein F5Y17DRAFT_472096 [Xylariaceae sp. FL0594]|nr:hypothetical protein F5Y17DRAFT_472096 [Xylariaceae sp. FL0594]